MYSLHIHSYDQGYEYKIYFSESIYVFAAHTQLWSRLWSKNHFSESIYVFAAQQTMIKVMITSVRVYMYSLHIHSYDQGYDYKNDPLQWEYICIRCTYTAMIKVMSTKSTSVRVYMYSLHIHSYDQGYDYKNHFSESIYVFAAHTQLWSRLWLQKPLQWEYICIRCTYTAMIKVMITKTTSVRVYMYSLHIHSYDQGYEYKNHFSESIYVFAAHTQLWSRLWVQNTKTTSVRVYMYSLHIHSYDQGYDYKNHFSESIYVFAAHTQLWSRLWLQKPLQWEYICIRCTYTAMIKVMITKTTSVRVYMYSLHIHSYDQGYEYKIYFSESIYVFAAHTQLWSRLWLQKTYFSESIYVFAAHTQLWSRLWVQNLLQWEYICIRCTYTAMIKVHHHHHHHSGCFSLPDQGYAITKTTSVRVYMYSLHIHSYDQGYEYKIYFSESIYVFAAHTQLWSRLWVQNPLQWEYICIRCTYTAMIKVMITKNHFSESMYVFAAHTQLWSRLWLQKPLQWEYICIRCTYKAMIKVMITKTTSVRVYMYSLHIHSYDQGYEYKIYFSESIYVFAAHTQLWSRLWVQNLLQWEYICIRCTYTAMIKVMITKTLLQWEYICIRCTYTAMIKVMSTKSTSVRVYMYSHTQLWSRLWEYIYVFAAHTQLWSRLWLQKPLQWEYICIRCTYTAMIKVMITKTTSVRVYMYSLHIHSYDQGYDYKNHFSESICVFAAHTQLWSRLWVQNLLQWEYICIRCTYTAMIKVMSTKSTSVRVYMYSLHIHSYQDQNLLQWELYVFAAQQSQDLFSESIYVFAAHTQLWSRLWVQNLLQWEYICIRCTYTAMIKVMITKTTSMRVYMYSLHIHSYDQGYDYKNHFSESIYVFAAHTQLWSRLWLQKPLQWEYICIRCTYTAMIKVMITKTTSVRYVHSYDQGYEYKITSVRVYMYSLHIHSYDQGYEYKIYFSESIYVFAAHTQLWSRLWVLQKPLQWEYICIRCTYTAMIKVMSTKSTSVRVYMYSLHIHSYDQGYEYKIYFSESIYVFAAHTQLWSRLWLQKTYFSESIYVFAAHTQLWSRLWLQNLLQWEYICIRCTYTAMIKVMSTKSTSVRVYMYSLHIHSYDQGYDYKNHFSESIYVFAAHTQLWSRLWLQKPLQWEYICIRCTYTAMIKVIITKSLQWEYMYLLHIHSHDQDYDYKI